MGPFIEWTALLSRGRLWSTDALEIDALLAVRTPAPTVYSLNFRRKRRENERQIESTMIRK